MKEETDILSVAKTEAFLLYDDVCSITRQMCMWLIVQFKPKKTY